MRKRCLPARTQSSTPTNRWSTASFAICSEANHWDKADQYLTERYLQHNPNAASGSAGVVQYFTKVLDRKPSPIPEKIKTPVAFVTAEGDLVTVGYVREIKDEKDPAKTYTTTWYDTWRIKDGKADEHWDPATKP
ncbi:nuclear transport factor 2 family protein [Rhizobium sp. RCAM05350]|nr:nuclear transport factor 2 family protein [Rhizobium sp. RCAM05350]